MKNLKIRQRQKNKIAENDNYKAAYIYLKEDYCNKPKEMFKYLGKLITANMRQDRKYSILDIGCARGEFLYYLKSIAKFEKTVGVDYSQALINEAKKFKDLKDAHFYCDFAESFNLNEKFDFVAMTGVLSFFDDIKKPLDNLGRHLKTEGVALITGLFNVYDIDVIVKYRNNKYSNTYESGWNNHSIESIKKYLDKINMQIVDMHRFELPFDLKKQDDRSRSWTLHTEEGKRFVNGLGFIYDIMTLDVRFKDISCNVR